MRALETTARATRDPTRTLPLAIAEWAELYRRPAGADRRRGDLQFYGPHRANQPICALGAGAGHRQGRDRSADDAQPAGICGDLARADAHRRGRGAHRAGSSGRRARACARRGRDANGHRFVRRRDRDAGGRLQGRPFGHSAPASIGSTRPSISIPARRSRRATRLASASKIAPCASSHPARRACPRRRRSAIARSSPGRIGSPALRG